MSALRFETSDLFFFFSFRSHLPEPFQCLHSGGKRSDSAKVVLALTEIFVIRRVDTQSTLQTIVDLYKVNNETYQTVIQSFFVWLLRTIGNVLTLGLRCV